MQLTFRTKLLAGQMLLVGVVMAIVTFTLDRSLSADLQAQLEQRLEQQAMGSATWINQNRHPEKLVSRLSDAVSADVALFDLRGNLVAASPGADTTVAGELEAAKMSGKARGVRTTPNGEVAQVVVQTAGGLLRLFVQVRNLRGPMVILGVPAVDDHIGALRGLYQVVCGAVVAADLPTGGGKSLGHVAAKPARGTKNKRSGGHGSLLLFDLS